MHSGCMLRVYTQAHYMIQEYLWRSKNIIRANMYVSKIVQADIPLPVRSIRDKLTSTGLGPL